MTILIVRKSLVTFADISTREMLYTAEGGVRLITAGGGVSCTAISLTLFNETLK